MGQGRAGARYTFLYIDGNKTMFRCEERSCLQLTLFHGLLQNDVVLITLSSSRNFNSRVQTIDLKICISILLVTFKNKCLPSASCCHWEEGNLKYLLINSLYSQVWLFFGVYILCHMFYLHCLQYRWKILWHRGRGVLVSPLFCLFCYCFIGLIYPHKPAVST